MSEQKLVQDMPVNHLPDINGPKVVTQIDFPPCKLTFIRPGDRPVGKCAKAWNAVSQYNGQARATAMRG